MSAPVSTASGPLAQLLGFLETDPRNLSLLSDAAEAALAEGQAETALALLERYEQLASLRPRETNLRGLAFLQLKDYAAAERTLSTLGAEGAADPALRFNRAWCRAMTGDNASALAFLDEATVTALPQAAALQIELQHDSGLFDEAWENAKLHTQRFPNHAGVLSVASVIALDMEEPQFAREAALGAGNQPRALATLGILALGETRNAEAHQLFTRALESDPNSPRAWLGKGLAELSAGAQAEGAEHIRHGAELFKEHWGAGSPPDGPISCSTICQKRASVFENAYALDRNFAETIGSLAVLSVFEGDAASAKRLAEAGAS